MPDLYSLLLGAFALLAAGGLFGGNVGSVLVQPIEVPAHMAAQGYAGGMFNQLLQGEIDRIYFAAGADYVGASVQTTTEDLSLTVNGTGISLTMAKIMAYRALGKIRMEFAGGVIERDGGLVMVLTGRRNDGQQKVFTHTATLDDPYALVQAAALDIVTNVDPYEEAKLQFEADKVSGDFSRSLAMIASLFLRLPPTDFHYLYNLAGRALQLSGRPTEALAAYRKAIQANPGYALTYSNVALLLDEQGHHEQARRYDRAALQLDPKLYRFFRQWADAYQYAGEDVRCAYNFSRFMRYVKDDASAYFGMGACLTRLGRAQEAQAAFERATALNHDLRTFSLQ
jgi:tetratricopeptide (TPR) repeat protein